MWIGQTRQKEEEKENVYTYLDPDDRSLHQALARAVDETEEQVFKQEVAPEKEDVEEKIDVMASFMLQAAQ